jgi:hypothetical protein
VKNFGGYARKVKESTMDKIEKLIAEIKSALEDGQLSLREALRIAMLLFELLNMLLPLIIGQAVQEQKAQQGQSAS